MKRQIWPIYNCTLTFDNRTLIYPLDVFQAYYNIAPKYLIAIIEKWEKGKDPSEREYYQLIKKLFSYKSRKANFVEQDLTKLCGVYWLNGWQLVEEKKYEIEKIFLRYCLGKILDEFSQPVINKYFPNIKFDWELYPLPDPANKKLHLQIKIAFMFTLYNYINYYETKPDRIGSFIDYYLPELEKRLILIQQVWEQHGENIEYIPLFEDDFRYFTSEQEQYISRVISNIFISEPLSNSINKVIEDALIKQAKTALENQEPLSFQPLIIKIVSLQKSREFLQTALLCYQHGYYNSTVNRSYYAMLRSARALLSSIGYVKPWQGKNLRVMESHEEIMRMIEQKLINELALLSPNSINDFKKVFYWRMLADYAEEEVKNTQALNMYKKAERFYHECLKAIEKIGGESKC